MEDPGWPVSGTYQPTFSEPVLQLSRTGTGVRLGRELSHQKINAPEMVETPLRATKGHSYTPRSS